jgi:lipopolysaccharide transport system permease protein
VSSYWRGIWNARHFWVHLSLSDLRARWRHSFFGILWSVIQPLGMTLLLAMVFSRLFSADIVSYAPYILSGMIVWECVTGSVTGGALSFVQADAYIKQCRHPLAIYTLRTVLTNLIVLGLASIALYGWALIALPENFGWSWLATLFVFPVLALILWPLATLLAYFGTRFRDVPHAIGLMMQALWFVSPVYFEAKMFKAGGLNALVDYNPIYHLLQIIRAPLLSGAWPTLENFVFSLGTAGVLALMAWFIGARAERKVIFYL